MAVWHGDGRVATETIIPEHCRASSLDRYLEQFQEGAKKGVARLLTAFYFRQAGDVRGEKTFEFTHKSVSEYLTARRLVRMMERVEKQLEMQAEDPEYGWNVREVLRHWAEICGPTAIDEYVVTFLRNEIALRPIDWFKKWQGIVCRLIESAVTHAMLMEELKLLRFQ